MTGPVITSRRTGLGAFAFIAAVSALPQWAVGQSMGVYGLTQAGWEIVEQIEKQEIRSGVSPYSSLQRVVSVTEYHLEKEGQTMICRLSYDSQQDTQEEKCEEYRD